MDICVVGTGYVGLVTGTCFAEFGVSVTCVDVNQEKISQLHQGQVPIYEPGLEELISKNTKEGRLYFSTDIPTAIRRALVIFIAVGTPQGQDGSADLKYVRQVAEAIGRHMTGYKVVVTKSTVPVGTGELIRRIIQENQTEVHPFDIVSNPEFLREGSAIEDFMRPNRVVIGAESEKAIAIMRELYSPLYLLESPFVITDVATSEMIKYASNAFLAAKVSFVNEMANLCELVGADVQMVAKGMGMDNRIGPKFLHAGPGYGGSCFPKDTKALAQLAREHGYEFRIVESVIQVNEERRGRMTDKIVAACGGQVSGKTITCLGLTFKPNTDDIREAPAEPILRNLIALGARIRAFDPAGMAAFARTLPQVTYGDNAYQVCEGADCLILMTEWNQFRNLNLQRIKELMNQPVLVDLRNVYSPEKVRSLGFRYYCVGRP